MGERHIALAGYVPKYTQCPRCNSENIVYTYVLCSNESIQYRCECRDCRAIIPVPHIENAGIDRKEQNNRNAWANEVKRRDGYACRLCGSKDGVEAHHIVPYDADPDQRYNPENGITLCRLHHDQIHTWRKAHGEEVTA